MGAISYRKVISTDVSNLGWGALFKGRPVFGQWSDQEKCLHINCLEMIAVENALRHFLPFLWGHHVLVRTDNMSVVAYMNHQGGIRSRNLNALAERLFVWAQHFLLSLRAAHMPGRLNNGPGTVCHMILSTQNIFYLYWENKHNRLHCAYQEQLKMMKKNLIQKNNDMDKEVLKFKEAVVSHKRSAQAAVENSDRIFTEIIRSIQNIRAEVREKIRAQENKEVRDAEIHIQRLQQKIVKLQKENFYHSEMEVGMEVQIWSTQNTFYLYWENKHNRLHCPYQRSAQAAVENSDRIFTEIIRSIQNIRAEVREKIRAQENKELRDAENHIQRLQQEIVKLQKETCKLEPLLHTEDHIYFFQNYASCSTFTQRALLPRKINDIQTFENVEKSVSNLKIQLDKLCEEHMGRISETDQDCPVVLTDFES
ncbi:unnamed protein product [Leuciscus chuanchicus]